MEYRYAPGGLIHDINCGHIPTIPTILAIFQHFLCHLEFCLKKYLVLAYVHTQGHLSSKIFSSIRRDC